MAIALQLQLSERPTSLAPWSLRLALLSLQLLIVVVVLHRFASLDTSVAINLLLTAYAGAALAVLLALVALRRIWYSGERGASQAGLAMLLGLCMYAWPASYLPQAVAMPPLNDVTTDPEDPPRFAALSSQRGLGSNPVAYPGRSFADKQLELYPSLRAVVAPRPVGEAFVLVRETVKRFGWEIVAMSEPRESDRAGIIEAVDRSLIVGFPDDVAVRVTGDDTHTRIDVRSASRYGTHDFGRNAERVATLLKAIRVNLAAAALPEGDEAAAQGDDDAAGVSAKSRKSSSETDARRKKRVRVQLGAQDAQAQKAKRRQRAQRKYLDKLDIQSTR